MTTTDTKAPDAAQADDKTTPDTAKKPPAKAPKSAKGGVPEPGVIEDEPTLYPPVQAALRGLRTLALHAAESHGDNERARQLGDELLTIIEEIDI